MFLRMVIINKEEGETSFACKQIHMSVIIILLLASISIAAFFLVAFIWSVRTGQFDDEFSPPNRILFDDKITESSNKPTL